MAELEIEEFERKSIADHDPSSQHIISIYDPVNLRKS